jgi:hypothetical protein
MLRSTARAITLVAAVALLVAMPFVGIVMGHAAVRGLGTAAAVVDSCEEEDCEGIFCGNSIFETNCQPGGGQENCITCVCSSEKCEP